MLTKQPKTKISKWFKRGALTLFFAEAVGFVVCYGVWYQVNTNRDFRKVLKENYPSLLDSYYKVGEYLDPKNQIRQIDIAQWNAEEKLSK